MSIFAELKRRNVIRVAVAYVITAWLILQVADVVLGNIDAPGWVFRTILLVLVLGSPLAMLFAWAYELTPEGLKRESEVDRAASVTHETGRKLDRAIITVLICAVAYFAFDKFSGHSPGANVTAADTTTSNMAVSTAVAKSSIAVLPFVNMSSDPEQEYFSDGISEELLNLLAKIPQFQVAGRTSSFAFKGANDDLRVIGDSLGVHNILEGSVRKGGDRVRITAQLVKVDDGFHLWSETYDRKLTDILAVQDEIATAVVDQLKVKLLGFNVTEGGGSSLYANPDAHSSYLQGLFYLNNVGADNYRKAVEFFEKAVALAPNSALAWASLAGANIRFAGQTDQGAAEALARGREQLATAFSLDDRTPEAYIVKADLAMSFDWDWDVAEAAIERALSLRPGDTRAGNLQAALDSNMGRTGLALQRFRGLVNRDPLDLRLQLGLASELVNAQQLGEAESVMNRLIERDPTANISNAYMSFILSMEGRYEEALAYGRKEPVDFMRLNVIAIAEQALGNTDAAVNAQQELLEKYGDLASYQQATIFAWWGQPDTAVAWLERAYDARDPGIASVKPDPSMKSLRDHPGFIAILEKMNLAD